MAKKIRSAEFKRKTNETDISGKFVIDGSGKSDISTGIGFLDHMLTLFTFHGLFDLKLKARGDLKVDIHHTNEDIAICLGRAFKEAIGDCKSIQRYGSCDLPMDMTAVKVMVDISGRHAFAWRVPPAGSWEAISRDEGYSLQDGRDFLEVFSKNANINLHIDVYTGEDMHHVLEAIFKALALALDAATKLDPRRKGVPSTKGIIDL